MTADNTNVEMSNDEPAEVEVLDLHPEAGDVKAEVITGLRMTPKRIPSKYFYDTDGSALFEEICDQPEYYPTRVEMAITKKNAVEIAERCGARCLLVEFGSGSGVKTRVILEHLDDPAGYVPIDISRSALVASSRELNHEFPDLEVLPVLADYTRPYSLPTPKRTPARRVAYFPGSTIGNFIPEVAVEFLRRVALACGPGGGLVIGVDRYKSREILEPAYNDAAGVTAAFNLNLLKRVKSELGGDLDIDGFRHKAIWVNDLLDPDVLHGIDMADAVPGGWRHASAGIGRMEMRLISKRQQRVHIGETLLEFEQDEPIITEYSYKYSPKAFIALAAEAGFQPEAMWTDQDGLFSLHFLGLSSQDPGSLSSTSQNLSAEEISS